MATRHLVSLGHRDIAFMGDAIDNSFGFTSSARRQQGYEEVLRSAGIRPRRSYVRHGPHERDAARRMAEQLLHLRVPPTAVFAASDVQATGVLEAARQQGVGRKLLATAEQKARDLGAHSVTLSTFEWQARGFYIKQGYEEFGHIDNYIQGFQLVYLKKSLTA